MTWKKISGLGVVLAFVALLGFGLTLDPSELSSPLVGSAAPGFRLEVLEGGGSRDSVGLAELEAKGAVVNFWASWCLACIQEHPALVRAWRRYEREGIQMVGIVYQDRPSAARRYLERYGGGWLQLMDPGSRTAIDYGVYGIPETFFIDSAGTITHKHVGPVDDQVLDREIGRLLSGEREAQASPASETGMRAGEPPDAGGSGALGPEAPR